jgi:hypothetical protein
VSLAAGGAFLWKIYLVNIQCFIIHLF